MMTETIHRYANQESEKAIDRIAALTPEELVRDRSPLSDEQQRQILIGWNSTTSDYPRQSTVQELFEAQVARTPQAVAATFGDESLTYAELNERANQLARQLRAIGVGPETPVAICVERSLEMIVGLLGILKADGAYVPIDPELPEQRIDFILQDTQATVVLTVQRFLERIPGQGRTTITLDHDWTTIAAHGAGNLEHRAGADNLAYVIYTSGSTGRPKGTTIVHRSIARLVLNTNFAEFGPDTVFLQFAPLAFDASTLEIWAPLLHGGRLVIAPPGTVDLEQLSGLIRREGVTMLWLTAGLFHQMAEGFLKDLGSVRQFLAGGDVLSVSHFNRVIAEVPGIKMTNGYGPTENTTFTCCHVATEPIAGTRVPIGRPIANTQVYILDHELCPVPVGVWGELYTAGDGLARGYLHRPALTAEKFLPNPFGEPGTRMYRTGDMVRYLPDGTIEFKGRADNQVKIRGFRIELGEIEAVLAQHERVKDVVILARDDQASADGQPGAPSAKRLVAYVVEHKEPTADSKKLIPALREHLRNNLPAYMMPSAFVVLDAFPLTANGKVDRRALPAPDQTRGQIETPYVEPETRTEQRLAELWIDMLGVSMVGRDDDFFELGGDSLLAMRINMMISEIFGVRIPPRRFYEGTTLAELAQTIDELSVGEQQAVGGQ